MIKQTSTHLSCFICGMQERISSSEATQSFNKLHALCAQKKEEKKQAEKDILYHQLRSFHTLNLARPGRWDK